MGKVTGCLADTKVYSNAQDFVELHYMLLQVFPVLQGKTFDAVFVPDTSLDDI